MAEERNQIVISFLKSSIPWQAKIAAKIILARLPISYGFWKKLGLFEHGAAQKPEYTMKVIGSHIERAFGGEMPAGISCLELGPGDTAFSAMIVHALGAKQCILVDAGDYISRDMKAYKEMANYLEFNQMSRPAEEAFEDIESMMAACGGSYHSKGLASLRKIPDKSIGFIWSHAVLEHIPLAEFDETMVQLRRILKDDGVCSHRIDLADHLGGALNNLRVSDDLWESKLFSQSGFYTNRIRMWDMIGRFEAAGFMVEVPGVQRWEKLPTEKEKLAQPFRDMANEYLIVRGFDAILRPNSAQAGSDGRQDTPV